MVKAIQTTAIIYRRKSTDDKENQVLSLQSQYDDIYDKILSKNNYRIIADLEEAKTAKRVGREEFAKLVELCKSGRTKTIITWHPNRLARNPIDAGAVIDLVVNHGVTIITCNGTYNAENYLLLYIEFGMSDKYSTDLAKVTKRGVDDKIKMGWAPVLAPPGYKNTPEKKQGERKILPDHEDNRFELMKKLWKEFTTGKYSAEKIRKKATYEWGFKKRNGKPLSKTQIYEVLTNPFYYGDFKYGGKIYEGSHKPMVTRKEWNKVQEILGTNSRPRAKSREFAYTGLIKCACGCSLTAIEKHRKTCKGCGYKYNAENYQLCPKCKHEQPDETIHHYCYYHCTNKRKDNRCLEPSITLANLEAQFEEFIDSLNIPQPMIDWAVSEIKKKNATKIKEREDELKRFEKQLQHLRRRETVLKKNFNDPANEDHSLMTPDEFKEEKDKIREEMDLFEERLHESNEGDYKYVDRFLDEYELIKEAKEKIKTGAIDEKRTIISKLCLNPVLKDGKVLIQPTKKNEVFQKGKFLAGQIMMMFEPKKLTDLSMKNAHLSGRFPEMGS